MHCISRLVSRQLPSLATRHLHVTAMAPVAVGDKVPSVTLFENSPGGKVELAELCAGKKVNSYQISAIRIYPCHLGCDLRSAWSFHPWMQQDPPPRVC